MPTTAVDPNNALTTLDLTKEYLGESTGTTGFNSRLNSLINSVSHRINSQTARQLKRRSHEEQYDGHGRQTLVLDHFPIQSVSTDIGVWVVSSRDSFSSTSDFDANAKVDAADIHVDKDEGIIRIKDESFTQGVRNVLVTYSAGYSTTTATTASDHIPGDLQEAVHQMIAYDWQRQRQSAWATRTISHDDGSISYIEAAPLTAMTIIDSYRDQLFA